jgi:membrane complex biogenesis BtpA family protein
MHTYISGEGLIKGQSHKTLRLKQKLRSSVQIWADVGVKHAKPVEDIGIAAETKDITDRGMVDALIVTGERTGDGTKLEDLKTAKGSTTLPVLVGSGVTPDNIEDLFGDADGFIVGSYFKEDGKAENFINEDRVKSFFETFCALK